ncbi:MAG: CoA-acylating methylmalonate-semialdehyde dehydrogenase [Planctomycetota bacterium]|nr:CoA-acylating methylmalonate-semialdehyde dehydrogenase [Planctomycetota bacterium]
MARKLKFFVGGQWRETSSGQYMPVYNTSTGEVMAEAPKCTAAEVEEAVEAAAAAFPAWRDTPLPKRTQVMFRFKELIEKELDSLAKLISTEMGKNLNEARGDVLKVIEVVELACALPVTMQGRSLMNVSTGYDTVTYREPLGVFAGIAPYNFPAMIPFGWMIPLAVTTGNSFVLKAASMVPQTGMRLAELLDQAGLPRGVLNLVTCSRNEAEILLRHPAIKGVCFVGSTKIGLHVYQTAAAHGKRVQCQTEAKNHALVLRDAPIRPTAARIINSAFGCAGQRCMALPVACVEEAIADDLVAAVVEAAKKLRIGPAWEPETELGPVISAEHRKWVCDWIERGIKEGARLVLDGRGVRVPGYENGFFLGPTVFDHVGPGMRVGTDEIFGPVLCIKRVKDFDEGVELINSSEFANGSSIFTLNGYYAREFSRRIHAGMVGINVGIPVPISAFPFCGHKASFFGDLHCMGTDGVAFFTETKAVTSHWFSEDEMKQTKVSTWEGTISRT